MSIIGSGRVGSATAFLAASNSLDDIHLINRHKEKALGQALDISNAIPENSPITIVGSDYSEIKNSEVLIISNPVDVLTYLFLKESGLPRERVMGMASSLDSSRFRYLIARELDTNQSEIKNALVLGEHGDSMVQIFSLAKWRVKQI